MDAVTMRVVVKTVVTPKLGLTICYHCENWIIGGDRVYFRPYIYHNIVKKSYYQQVTPVFQLTTELTTVYRQVQKKSLYANLTQRGGIRCQLRKRGPPGTTELGTAGQRNLATSG